MADTEIVYGARITGGDDAGSIGQSDTPLDNSGGTNVDYAIGAFTGLADLPTAIDDDQGFLDFAAALMAKTSEVYDGGITLTNIFASRFYGVGGGGNDLFQIHNTASARMYGRDGDDQLIATDGGSADDTLDGGAGDDLLRGGGGSDSLVGGDDDDTLKPGQGDDTLAGGLGIDTADYSDAASGAQLSLAETGPQALAGFAGVDTLSGIEDLRGGNGSDHFTGDDGANVLDGAGNNDTLLGGEGDDTLIGGAHDNSLNGGAGFDWLSYADTPSGMTVLLFSDTIIRNGFSDNDTAAEIEGIIGTAFVDDLAGDSGRNAIRAGDSADTLSGKEESDTLDGGAGADGVYGDEGSDVIVGGEGDDTLDGGADSDFGDYRTAAAGVTVDLTITEHQATGGAGSDKLVSVENLLGSQFRDELTGDDNANRLEGRGGKDTLSGAAGADTLIGGFGKDVFVGGAGADEMSGGPNKDRFIYEAIGDSTKAAPDRITDLASDDRILLTGIDANVTKDGNQAFELVADFTGKAGQATLKYDSVADETRLLLDDDGDAKADAVILFDGHHLSFTNFAL